MTRPLCRCPASKWPHVHVPVDKDDTHDWPDDAKLDDPRRNQAKQINGQRYERKSNE